MSQTTTEVMETSETTEDQTETETLDMNENETQEPTEVDDNITDESDESEDEDEDPENLVLSKRSKGKKSPRMRPTATKSNIRPQSHTHKAQYRKGLGKGRGKGFGKGRGKGLGKGVRHKRPLKDNIMGITKPAIKRLARRGGVKRIKTDIYDMTRLVLKDFLTQVVKDAVTYMHHAKRKTVSTKDVNYALKRSGQKLYGFGD